MEYISCRVNSSTEFVLLCVSEESEQVMSVQFLATSAKGF